MPEERVKYEGKPGLIQLDCPVEGCKDIHRVPIEFTFSYGISDSGAIEIEVFPPKPDISKMSDHLAYEHGVF